MRWEQLDEDLTYDGQRARPGRRRRGPDPHRHPHLPGPAVHRHLPRPHRGPEDPHLREGRLPRRRHRADRAGGVREGQRLLREDHLPHRDRPGRRRRSTDADGKEVERIDYKSSGLKPEDLLSSFRNSYNPAHRRHRGHDRHRHGHQAAGDRDVHALCPEPQLLRADEGAGRAGDQPDRHPGVTPDAKAKDHFVIVDCVGVTEHELSDTYPLDRKKHGAVGEAAGAGRSRQPTNRDVSAPRGSPGAAGAQHRRPTSERVIEEASRRRDAPRHH